MRYQEMGTNNSNLEFRKIKSLNYLYEVNSNGTIFRNVKSKKQSKIKLDMHHSKTGYYAVFVHIGGRQPDHYSKRVMIHRVVAECWLGNCPEGYEVDHIDRNSHNNDYRNLRYVTRSEQMKNRDHTRIGARGAINLEIARQERAVAVTLVNETTDERMNFETITECADYLACMYDKNMRTVRFKLQKRRSHIYDYDVIYDMPKFRNAETVHDGSTEQETVHLLK